MCAQAIQAHIRQFSEIIVGLPEEKVAEIISYARRVKQETQKSMEPLSAEEILTLAAERAKELRRQPRPVVEAQYQVLLDALAAEVTAKGIEAEEYPSGD
jgi:nitroreductase